MSSRRSGLSFLYAEGPTGRWLRRAVAGIDESLDGLCREHWLAAAPRAPAVVVTGTPAVRTCGAIAARRAI